MTTPVWFPVTGLDISRYIEKSASCGAESQANNYDSSDCEGSYDLVDATAASKSDLYMYDLFAVANHRGTNMANGHYTGKGICSN